MGVTSWIRRQFNNGVITTGQLNAPLGSGVTSTFSVGSGQGSSFPDGSIGSFITTIDQGASNEEKILCASRSGDTFTIASSGRGYNGTTAQNHASGAFILHTIDAQDLDEANQVAHQTLGAISASGDLLQGSAANTLTRLARGAAGSFLQVVGSSAAWTGLSSATPAAIAASGVTGVSTNLSRDDHTHSGVLTFNTRNGAVTLTAADVEALFSADKQIFSGTGSGTGEIIDLLTALEEYFASAGQLLTGTGAGTGELLAAGSAGTVLTVGGADASGLEWIYPALTSAAGHLSGDYSVTGSLATYLTTASLAAGTWLITHCASIDPGTSAGVEVQATTGTATATFEGKVAEEVSATSTSSQFLEATLSFIATVTVTGTLVFQGKNTGAASLIKATTPTTGLAKATGYTAVRVA